jgi:solute carrier family 13 (sodium-dependent dicarboxylate transporter), member 2/3/5
LNDPSASPSNSGDATAGSAELIRRIGFWLGVAAFVTLQFFIPLDAGRPSVSSGAAVAALMAIWWMSEAFPLAVTALVPIVLFPLLGVMPAGEVAPSYIDSNIFLFAGGFVLALAMERWRLHRRIALIVLLLIGGRPARIVLGFMTATAILSMWVSNTATAMMMLPMALSLSSLFESAHEERRARGEPEDPRTANFPLVLLLGIAYAASIGGVGTIIGTPPNVVLVAIFNNEFPGAPPITFAQWFMFAAPLAAGFLLVAWAVLSRFVYPLPATSPFSGRDYIRTEYRNLGPLTREEATVATVFSFTALLWIFRKEITFGEAFAIPGWSNFLPHGANLDDGTIAMIAALALFILPASRDRGGGGIMNWETARKLPWEILILFGGGFALARGFTVSGLSEWIGARFDFLEGAPTWMVVATICGSINFLTELTSNTATTQMILPILASLAQALEVNPLLFMVPAAISASFAFMLPVATPPNAIIYGSGRVPIGKMIRAGIVLNLVGIALATLFGLTLALPAFDISMSVFPDWAAAP